METIKNTHRLNTVDNAISLMMMFLRHDTIGLTDIEQETGISKTAAFRLVSTMVDRGLLMKDSKTKRYFPGPLLFQLGHRFQAQDIVKVSMPYIQQLAAETKESVYLSIRSGNRYLYLSGIDSVNPLKVTSPFGEENDLYYGASGKLHMAYMSEIEIENYFKWTQLKSYTPKTITDPPMLKEELRKIRQCGYAVSIEERISGSCGFAAPIWGLGEEPVASLGILIPKSRLTSENQKQLIALLVENGKNISEQFMGKNN